MTTTPTCTIDANGLTKPAFADCLAYFQNGFQQIYGADIYIEPDSQDGQFIALLAKALDDVNALGVAVYNAFSPSTAQGIGLSRVVKINGIKRLVPSYSTATVTLVGQSGTEINGGYCLDQNGNKWDLPSIVLIPTAGQVDVTATCETAGAIVAPAGTITTIGTPTAGWQSVTNAAAATPGAPLENDAMLRNRQTLSTMLPSSTILDGIMGAIAALPTVTRYRAYENDSPTVDANGLPAHSLSIVVDGGDQQAIANVIGTKKSPGTSTYGTTTVIYVDNFGIGHNINFYRPTKPPITWNISVKALNGFTTDIQNQIAQAVSDWTNALGIGQSILLPRAWVPANLTGGAAATFELTAVQAARDGNVPTNSDVTIAFNEAPYCEPDYVTIKVS